MVGGLAAYGAQHGHNVALSTSRVLSHILAFDASVKSFLRPAPLLSLTTILAISILCGWRSSTSHDWHVLCHGSACANPSFK